MSESNSNPETNEPRPGDAPTRDAPTGDTPTRDAPTGDTPTGDASPITNAVSTAGETSASNRDESLPAALRAAGTSGAGVSAVGAAPESQKDRWLKYGGNVLLTSIAAVALAALATYAAERKPARIDTTATGLYSLKPQTVKIVRDLKSPIRLVSLYTKSKPPQSDEEADENKPPQVPPEEAAQTVNDLLEEYANKGHGITAEFIDPVTSPTKVDDLIDQVENKYGGEVKKYRDFVNSFKGTIEQVKKIADPEVEAVRNLPLDSNTDRAVLGTLREAFITVQAFPKRLDGLQESLQKPLKQKPPDYKGAADAIKGGLDDMSSLLDLVINNFTVLKSRGGLPPDIAKYMTDSLPHYQQMKKLVDDAVVQAKGLGELKLDTLRTALKERNTILVMGDKEWRVIRHDQVWKPAGRTAMSAASRTPPKPRFAGEQQVTAAILALSSGGQKPKVCFVRAGGPPMVTSMFREAPMSVVADRLKLYNFDVTEKDLTGGFARQSQGMAPPEPSDEEIKDAAWVVLDLGPGQMNPETGEGGSIASQVAAHLKQGGSAVIIAAAKTDPMTEALSGWGLTLKADETIVHEKIPPAENSRDVVEEVLRLPFVFELHEFGEHPLAKPLGGLEGLFGIVGQGQLAIAPVAIKETAGIHAAPLLPIPTAPQGPQSWGSVSFDMSTLSQGQTPKFDSKNDDAGPLYAGAAAEKDGAGRLVVLGAGLFMPDGLVDVKSQDIDPNAPAVLRFPGNGELFTDSVFWAARQDTLIDISPAAMDVGRIKDMTPGALRAWKWGAMLIGLPGLVLLTGAGVYLKRRD